MRQPIQHGTNSSKGDQKEAAFFADDLEAFSGRTCLVTSDCSYTYDELLERGREILGELPSRQLVFIEGGNHFTTIAAYVAALRGGHVVHIVDPGNAAATKLLVERYQPNLLIRCNGTDAAGEIIDMTSKDLHPDLAVLLSTSGTTGSSKLVKLSRDNVAANTASIVEYLSLTGADRAVTTLKPFYSYGYSVINTHLAVGGSLLLTEAGVQSQELWSLIAEKSVTNIPGVPYTFEAMATMEVPWAELDQLRFMTQAGGRLHADLVRRFAAEGDRHGWSFFVMYGQTEGGPRLSYLPPHHAAQYPNSIGVAVPGGRLGLVDREGREISETDSEGELTYQGPNIMIGYSTSPEELATKEQIETLFTGDLAIRNAEGLFIITGRKSRFIKPMGTRISLDDVERQLGDSGYTFAVAGDRDRLVVFIESDDNDPALAAELATRYKLPPTMVHVIAVDALPRLASGKIDYRSVRIHDDAARDDHPADGSFLRSVVHEFLILLLGRSQSIESVEHAFSLVFPQHDLASEDSFTSIGGDSLAFVQLTVHLDSYFGDIPVDWHTKSMTELETLKRLGADSGSPR